MKKINLILIVVGLAFLPPGMALAQETEPDAGSAQEDTAPPFADMVFEHTDDPVFDRYVDLSMIEAAVEMLDSSLLTDLTLQLAEGERVLGRSHKAGTAETLARLAMQVAASMGDADSLERLGRFADRVGNAELARAIAAAGKLAGASRAEGSDAILDSLEDGQLALYLNLRQKLEVAKLRADEPAIKALQQQTEKLDDDGDLPQALQEQLTQDLNVALTRISKLGGAARSGEDDRNIDKLLSASRGTRTLALIRGDASRTLMGEFIKVPGGLKITSLQFNSPLERIPLQPGDILRSFDGITITDVAEVDRRIHGRTTIVVERNRRRATVPVNLPDNTMVASGGGGPFPGGGPGRPGGGGFSGTGGRPAGGFGGGGFGRPLPATPTAINVVNGTSFSGRTGHWVTLSDQRRVFLPGDCINGDHRVSITPHFHPSWGRGVLVAMTNGSRVFVPD